MSPPAITSPFTEPPQSFGTEGLNILRRVARAVRKIVDLVDPLGSRKMLEHNSFVARVGFDTAEH